MAQQRPNNHNDDSEDAVDDAEEVRALLEYTKQRISAGDRDEALASLVRAISLTRGEDAIFEVLSQARAQAAAQSTSSRQPRTPTLTPSQLADIQHRQALEEALLACEELMSTSSLLTDRNDGSEEILRDAFEDGSSVICKACGGLVKKLRWEIHNRKWCPSLPTQTHSGNSDDSDDADM